MLTKHFTWPEATKGRPFRDVRFQTADEPVIVPPAGIKSNIRLVAEHLEHIRRLMNRPLTINSWLRLSDSPEELHKKHGPGVHTLGLAVDVHATPDEFAKLISAAYANGCHRFGLHFASQFVHLDWLPGHLAAPWRPYRAMWTY